MVKSVFVAIILDFVLASFDRFFFDDVIVRCSASARASSANVTK